MNGVKGQYNNIVVVIQASCNPYDLTSVNSLSLDVETRLRDQLFDHVLSANDMIHKLDVALQISYESLNGSTPSSGNNNTGS